MPYFPDSIMRPNTKSEAADVPGVARVVSAADHNKHDEEIVAIQEAIGARRPAIPPSGFSCRGDSPGCSGIGASPPCVPSAYGMVDAMKSAADALMAIRDSYVKSISGIVAVYDQTNDPSATGKIPFPTEWQKTSLVDELPVTQLSPGSGNPTNRPFGHTVTALDPDRFLVIGGSDGIWSFATSAFGTVDTVEIFRVSTGAWTAVQSMARKRAWHTATLLSNGNILVVGGTDTSRESPLIDGTGTTGTVQPPEIYNPSTNQWSFTGNMPFLALGHTATLMVNGQVLVVGGYVESAGDDTPFFKAQLYDPISNSWSVAADMSTSRVFGCTAILLNNGKVLVFGGTAGVSPAELYDPTPDSWSTVGSMATQRTNASATLLASGKVLAIGGVVPAPVNNAFKIVDGSTELFDPNTNTWGAGGNLVVPANDQAVVLLADGRVICIGGWQDWEPIVGIDDVELYDPTSNTFTQTTHLAYKRYGLAAVSFAGGVLVVGGTSIPVSDVVTTPIQVPPSIEKLNVSTGVWTVVSVDSPPSISNDAPVSLRLANVSHMPESGYITIINDISLAYLYGPLFDGVAGQAFPLPAMSSLTSSSRPVFRIPDGVLSGFATGDLLVGGEDAVFGLGTNVEVLFYSGIDCNTNTLLNVYRGVNGTTVTAHGAGDIVFKGILSIQVSPMGLSMTGNTTTIQCRLRSDGRIELGGFYQSSTRAYAAYQAILIGQAPLVKSFDPSNDEEDCLAETSPSATVTFDCPTISTDVPVITGAFTVYGTTVDPFVYQISATNSPFEYDANGLPSGLNVNSDTGLISGTPTSGAGTFSVDVFATNDAGTGQATVTVILSEPPHIAPTVTSVLAATGTVGTAFSYLVTADAHPTSYNASGYPAGLSINTSTGELHGTPTVGGSFNVTISATNTYGTGSKTLVLGVSVFAPDIKLYHGGGYSSLCFGCATYEDYFGFSSVGISNYSVNGPLGVVYSSPAAQMFKIDQSESFDIGTLPGTGFEYGPPDDLTPSTWTTDQFKGTIVVMVAYDPNVQTSYSQTFLVVGNGSVPSPFLTVTPLYGTSIHTGGVNTSYPFGFNVMPINPPRAPAGGLAVWYEYKIFTPGLPDVVHGNVPYTNNTIGN